MSHIPHVIWNNKDEDRTGTPLVVLLHGYGSHEQDLMGMVPLLPQGYTYASLRAPQPCGMGFQWFPLSGDLSFSTQAVVEAVRPVADWLEEQAKNHSEIVLLGFSQGMAMATSVARHQPAAIRAVVGLSGFAVPVASEDPNAPFFDDAALRESPMPMFWGRDPQDPVIPQSMVDYTVEWAQEHTAATKVQYNGVGHGVSQQEIAHVGEYLRSVLG